MAFITEEDYRKTKGYAYAKWLEENEEFFYPERQKSTFQRRRAWLKVQRRE